MTPAEKPITITSVSTADLRKIYDMEALVLQGCGGDLQEWVKGINEMMTDQNILQKGSRFQNVLTFEHNGLTNLVFPFEKDVKLDVGRLAIWRLQTYEAFGGMWFSDYVPNRLGGFAQEQKKSVQEKPSCQMIGQDGNIFNLIGIAARTLRQHDLEEEVQEMYQRITKSGSYEAALGIIGEYVNITSVDDMDVEQDESMRME